VDTFESFSGLPNCEQALFASRRAATKSTMTELQLSDTDRIEWALKAFKRQVQKSGVLREFRRRRHYVKPSEARRLKAKAAKRLRDKNRRARSLASSPPLRNAQRGGPTPIRIL